MSPICSVDLEGGGSICSVDLSVDHEPVIGNATDLKSDSNRIEIFKYTLSEFRRKA